METLMDCPEAQMKPVSATVTKLVLTWQSYLVKVVNSVPGPISNGLDLNLMSMMSFL